MGADTGICDAPGDTARIVYLAAGKYAVRDYSFVHHVSVRGASAEESVIEGTARGLRTGASLSHVTMTGGTSGGIVVYYGEAPNITSCTISGNSATYGGGLYCVRSSSASLTNCTMPGTLSRNGVKKSPERPWRPWDNNPYIRAH